MKILLLGGTAESQDLVTQLVQINCDVVYSIAGLVRQPTLSCPVHSGGFSQYGDNSIDGLKKYVQMQNINLLLDVTHPYAKTISTTAATVARSLSLPYWRYQRPGWDLASIRGLTLLADIDQLIYQLANFKRPFFTIGASALSILAHRRAEQTWIVRSAQRLPDQAGVISVTAIGPFSLDQELALMRRYEVDGLITKNSGTDSVFKKLDAAQQLNLPIMMIDRPTLPPADREFISIKQAFVAFKSF